VKVAFDTSVIVAGTHDGHPHHGRAIVWIDAVLEQRITGVVTWHAVAEIWSVLTRLPAPARRGMRCPASEWPICRGRAAERREDRRQHPRVARGGDSITSLHRARPA